MQLPVLTHFFCLLLIANEARQFYKCKVAEILKAEGMDRFGGYSLGDWLCVIHYTSGFDTGFQEKALTSVNRFGIFQIDSDEWCFEDCIESKGKCKMQCSKLLDDDLKDDIACVKQIVSSYHDIEYWKVWRDYCYRKNNAKWLNKCKV